jgi:hypothetical protein
MDNSAAQYDALIRSGARRLTGYQRRLFQAEVATALCGGCARQAERRFGWGRETVEKGLHERQHGLRCLENFAARGRQRSEWPSENAEDCIRSASGKAPPCEEPSRHFGYNRLNEPRERPGYGICKQRLDRRAGRASGRP